MRDTMMNKNFPAGRFFLHSSYPPTFRSTLGSLRTHVEELGRVLSAQAQNDAIAKVRNCWQSLVHATVHQFVVTLHRRSMTPQGSGLCGDDLPS